MVRFLVQFRSSFRILQCLSVPSNRGFLLQFQLRPASVAKSRPFVAQDCGCITPLHVIRVSPQLAEPLSHRDVTIPRSREEFPRRRQRARPHVPSIAGQRVHRRRRRHPEPENAAAKFPAHCPQPLLTIPAVAQAPFVQRPALNGAGKDPGKGEALQTAVLKLAVRAFPQAAILAKSGDSWVGVAGEARGAGCREHRVGGVGGG